MLLHKYKCLVISFLNKDLDLCVNFFLGLFGVFEFKDGLLKGSVAKVAHAKFGHNFIGQAVDFGKVVLCPCGYLAEEYLFGTTAS